MSTRRSGMRPFRPGALRLTGCPVGCGPRLPGVTIISIWLRRTEPQAAYFVSGLQGLGRGFGEKGAWLGTWTKLDSQIFGCLPEPKDPQCVREVRVALAQG